MALTDRMTNGSHAILHCVFFFSRVFVSFFVRSQTIKAAKKAEEEKMEELRKIAESGTGVKAMKAKAEVSLIPSYVMMMAVVRLVTALGML